MISYLPLAKLMKEKNINFAELKRITGRNDGSLKIALCDGRYIKTSTLATICKTLNCNIEDVISWEPGKQKGLGKAKKVFINWEVLSDDLISNGTNLTNASSSLLSRSLNYLTGKRRDNKPLLLSELKVLANYCKTDFNKYISED